MADSDETTGGAGRAKAGEPEGGSAEPNDGDPKERGEGAAGARDPGDQGSGEGSDSEAADAPQAAAQNRRARRAARAAERAGGAPVPSGGGGRPGRSRAVPARPGEPGGGLDASERMDDALARFSDRAFRFLKANFNVVQWLIVATLAGWIGFQIYAWRADKAARTAAASLDEAVRAELGRVGAADQAGVRDERGSIDPRKIFATEEAQLAAARDGYQKIVAERPGTRAADLARLGLAGVLYDQGKHDEAIKLYGEVLAGELAKVDPEAKGRALEGSGLALEAKGDKDAALKRYQELENADIAGFKELAQYHQGRLLHGKGDKAGATEKLKKVVEKLSKETSGTAPGTTPTYLAMAAKDLLERVDPSALPKPSADEALQKALEAFGKNLPKGVTTVPTPLPAAPAP